MGCCPKPKPPCPRPKPKLSSACVVSCKCYRKGPMTNNAWLNFLRCYRASHCDGKTVSEQIKDASRKWCRMTKKEKEPFFLQAKRAPKKKKCPC